MFEFMTQTVIVTAFVFIMMLDAYLFLKFICWLFGKIRHRK